MEKILVIEDEISISTLLKFNLEKSGYTVITAMDGKEGLELAKSEKPDLILLDLMLPLMDGMEVCKNLRMDKNLTPILMLTAKDEELDKILGLELGADDYLTKPFSPREVVARVKAILRRAKQTAVPLQPEDTGEPVIRIGPLEIFPEKYEAIFNMNKLELTPKEFELLLYLAKNQNRVLTRDQLLNAVWNYDYVGDSRIVDVHISHLREKMEEDTKQPHHIKTVRGLGYKFEA
jgi:two-component system, OmpR family, alkaline phosphatase synthesis response regulator PhoP